MAEFQEVMRQWARMCAAKNGRTNLCSDKESGFICPMNDCGLCNKPLSSQTNDDILTGERIIMSWAAEHPEPVYPTWGEWFLRTNQVPKIDGFINDWSGVINLRIPAEFAEKLGIKPKKVTNDG